MPSYPGQMFTHTLDGLKGWPNPHALDIQGTISASVNIGSVGSDVRSGTCVHVSAVTQPGGGTPSASLSNNVPQAVFEMGANLSMMPIFLWVGTDGYDVSNPGVPAGVIAGGTTANPAAWIPIHPAGVCMGLVATGAYELETTEFDTTQTYLVNDFLRTVTSNTDANAGGLTNQNCATNQTYSGGTGKVAWGTPASAAWDSVVGVCSRGQYTNKNGVKALAFWPVYLPGSR